MSESKHTPGPWLPRTVNDIDFGFEINAGSYPIASVYLHNGRANARLIAAAPDMLEALRLIDAYLYATAHGSNEWQIVRDALAKAEGRS